MYTVLRVYTSVLLAAGVAACRVSGRVPLGPPSP